MIPVVTFLAGIFETEGVFVKVDMFKPLSW
jgi:hypothetical protein